MKPFTAAEIFAIHPDAQQWLVQSGVVPHILEFVNDEDWYESVRAVFTVNIAESALREFCSLLGVVYGEGMADTIEKIALGEIKIVERKTTYLN
jgi:hypothetical protein